MYAEQSHVSADYDEAIIAFRPEITAKEEPIEIEVESPLESGRPSQDDHLNRMDKEHDEYVASLRAVVNAESDHERKKELRHEARRWMGAVLFKTVGDVTHWGKVVDYEVESGWFKILYDDYEDEEMSKDELLRLLAEPEGLSQYADRLPASSEKRNPKRKKPETEKKKRKKPALAASATRAPTSTNHAAPTRQRRPRRAKEPSTYVPLALRETKKDAYYWYWP
ncbi:hypothetical protein PanWU01x14_194790 [Parasponia andersonii]|uniref:PTM/DIR17-like Tudor domain-containing protein n=1 Tax=Parasponia andersonii TaxID=3476 RepID=A0A2P5C033_PARAD|nr:hypothetical protein PanWU01x14_194790 [Parasponia andersonii]